MSITLTVFKSHIPSVNVILGNGKPCIFQNGVYRTESENEIQFLNAEIKAGHPHIFVDPNEVTIESDMVDPMNALRAKIIADYVAQQAAATNPANDMGTSDQSQVKPANSTDIASAVAGGDGAARLVNLASKLTK
jgi:hypothetical protein